MIETLTLLISGGAIVAYGAAITLFVKGRTQSGSPSRLSSPNFTDIRAGKDIRAGYGITTPGSIEAGGQIEAGVKKKPISARFIVVCDNCGKEYFWIPTRDEWSKKDGPSKDDPILNRQVKCPVCGTLSRLDVKYED